jgi:acetyl-CoA acyltransferase
MAREVYIVECARTPLGRGKKGGGLSSSLPVHVLGKTLEAVVDRAGCPKEAVEDIVCGVVSPVNQQGGNMGRLGALQAGFPVTTCGVQLNRMCGSGQQAIHSIAQAIAAGDMEIGIGCGVELMSVVPMGSDWPASEFLRKEFRANFPFQLVPQGQSAEMIAVKYGITREECDKIAFESHRKCGLAWKLGYFDTQLVPITVQNKDGTETVVERDEGVRFPPKMDGLKKLRTVFKKNGVVTAGNASQLSDGSGAVLLASPDAIRKYNLPVRARILSRVCVGSDPILMLDGVIPATQKALDRAGLTIADIDYFEINEAFASVVAAWQKTLGIDWEKVNPVGGACAHGHPLGATGAVLMTKLVNHLERTGKRYGLQTMCIGWGMATATVIEVTQEILPPRKTTIKAKL